MAKSQKTAITEEDCARLRGARLRATEARLAMLRVMRRARSPMSASTLTTRLARTMNAATVYRTLRSLERAQLVRRVNLEHDHAHFELTEAGDHHHLVCTQCGRTEDVTCTGIEEFADQVLAKSRSFIAVDRHAFELFGRCRACAT